LSSRNPLSTAPVDSATLSEAGGKMNAYYFLTPLGFVLAEIAPEEAKKKAFLPGVQEGVGRAGDAVVGSATLYHDRKTGYELLS